MTHSISKPHTTLYTDTRLFHNEVYHYIRSNQLFANRILKEEDITSLVDPIISFLFDHCQNLTVYGNGCYNAIFIYYSRDDFFELFDELILAFNTHLYYLGISRYQHYTVLRVDNFLTLFIDEGVSYGKSV